ncbi:hypothetical protein LEP1GSC170_4951 [Leptospira interrogans serovar Bataviae str. HAI135]|nr:hypothetical protein LEP1GSC170_4951 [Leptospira interrogans serovar Bataviae str. HAI135]
MYCNILFKFFELLKNEEVGKKKRKKVFAIFVQCIKVEDEILESKLRGSYKWKKRLNDIINVGIGAVQTSREIFDKLVDELNEGKEKIEARFDQLKTQGEKDMSDNALKLKVNLAWGLVRFEEIRDNILNHFIKK